MDTLERLASIKAAITANWLPQENPGGDSKYVMLPIPMGDAKELWSPGGTDPEDMHITLARLEDGVEDCEEKVRAAAKSFGKAHVTIKVSGIARYQLENKDAIVLLCEGEDLLDIRQKVLDEVGDDQSEHSFDPHITLGYLAPNEPHPKYILKQREVYIDTLVLGYDGSYHRIAFTDGEELEEMKVHRVGTVPKPKILPTYSARTTLRGDGKRRKIRPKQRISALRSLKSEMISGHVMEIKKILRYIRSAEGMLRYGGEIGDLIEADDVPASLRGRGEPGVESEGAHTGPALVSTVKKPAKPDHMPGELIAELANNGGPNLGYDNHIKAPIEEAVAARKLAIARAKLVDQPHSDMIADNKARAIERPDMRGAVDLRGGQNERRDRQWALFVMYGGLEHGGPDDGYVPCVGCGDKLSWYGQKEDGTPAPFPVMEQDKIIPTDKGGKYKTWNIQPMCPECNKERKDKLIHEVKGFEQARPEWLTDEWLKEVAITPPARTEQHGLFRGNEVQPIKRPKGYLGAKKKAYDDDPPSSNPNSDIAEAPVAEAGDTVNPELDTLNGADRMQGKDLLDLYENGTVTSEEDFTEKSSSELVKKITYDNGKSIIVKKYYKSGIGNFERDEYDTELLTPYVANAIGANAPRVVGAEDGALIQDFAEGQSGRDWIVDYNTNIPPERTPAKLDRIINSPSGRMMGLLDILIGNNDRHDLNWIVDKNGEVHGIDHGGVDFESPYGEIPLLFMSKFSRKWHDGSNKLNDSEIASITEGLKSIETQFKAAGRTKWYADLMKNWQRLQEGNRE